jgi:hypothetical protein
MDRQMRVNLNAPTPTVGYKNLLPGSNLTFTNSPEFILSETLLVIIEYFIDSLSATRYFWSEKANGSN